MLTDYLFWLFRVKKIEVHYTPTVEIKDYNVLIDLQPFYYIPIKKKNKLTKQSLNYLIMTIILLEIL